MKKNLLNAQSAEHLVSRVNKLEAHSLQLWGEMNATEMLLHCNSCNNQILTVGRGMQKTSFKQYLLRILALYIAPAFKKGLKSEHTHITKGKIDARAFEEQKQEFIRLVTIFPTIKKELTLTHPAFGNISTKQWGIAAYKHMDHHLRQFGV
jgi:hypothetical protein